MCDTLVALGNSTLDGSMIFAKNSDRDPNEAQQIVLIKGEKHLKDATVKCTYISIPQVAETYSILLSKPFWIWGAEMGANEHGVVIGNEAVFSKIPQVKQPSLIGMDYLRLGLERSKTAVDALRLIINLLEIYGQAGNCGYSHPFAYDNSYLIADQREAWVLETASRHWAIEKVKDIRSISNVYTIESEWYEASKDLVAYAVDRGWCKSRKDFSFKRCYSDFIFSTFGAGKSRHGCTSQYLRENKGGITVSNMMQVLRMHASKKSDEWMPGKALMGADVCMHLGFGPIRINQTTSSMVSQLASNHQTHWLTGTAAPCVSTFKPIWIDSGVPDSNPDPDGKYNAVTLWWQGEELHRRVLMNYPDRIKLVTPGRDELEAEFVNEANTIAMLDIKQRSLFSKACFKKSNDLRIEQIEEIDKRSKKENIPFYHRSVWKKYNKQAGFPM